MEEKTLGEVVLDNGLVLEFFDLSRPVAGDRWIVKLKARILVRVTPEAAGGNLPEGASFQDLRKILGESLAFEYVNSRNFIDREKKDRLLEDMKDRFLATNLEYLSAADFGPRFIIREFDRRRFNRPVWRGI